MMRAIIIDDEVHCINRLKDLLTEYCSKETSVEGCFATLKEGIQGVTTIQPDLVFLDVQLNDKTGFDLLREIANIDFEVIFTTAYEKYAIQAFRFSAIDYLLKPVDADELVTAVEKARKKISSSDISKKMETLFHNLEGNEKNKKLSIPTSAGYIFVDITDIIRCCSQINYTEIFLKDKQKITVAKTLKEFEELLEDHNFYRVHNSHLVNLGYIKKYNKGKGGTILMSDHSEIEVSTRRKEGFLKKIMLLIDFFN